MKTGITDYRIRLWLSADDTHIWANRPGEAWLCSELSDKRLFVEFDSNGLIDYRVNGRQYRDCRITSTELNAITSDFLRDKLPADHPLYYITVGQFNNTQTK